MKSLEASRELTLGGDGGGDGQGDCWPSPLQPVVVTAVSVAEEQGRLLDSAGARYDAGDGTAVLAALSTPSAACACSSARLLASCRHIAASTASSSEWCAMVGDTLSYGMGLA